MKYYFEKTINGDFEKITNKVRKALESYGFGVIAEIDMDKNFKEKLGVDFRPYKILGVCNPEISYEVLQAEDKIGTLLPCNVIIQELEPNKIEVAAVDPAASLMAIKNYKLESAAGKVRGILEEMIEEL